ncbi:ATP-binding cassette domain-containing protein [Chelatococcus sp. SYSU_G07232]|uniref:ATP-binding cassette domain-containing protein n=1 Tax=Chelatococcus albus TaxID=3047466 RepID=A0ABT7AFC7_9HYPH|nr:oligopeptide/dipeptide ABC transporter ATP-binding protein [Chelatococcus sp. SYSU_G07232]MDJ1157331.1 ATP-binding cassette domain-containing protein [Chelatococcus sp. SYSU_G07232]
MPRNNAATAAPLLEVEDLACWFDISPPLMERMLEGKPRQILKAVDGVSFSVARGTTLSIVGESGCGKSTIARLLVGLHKPTRGSIRFSQGAHGALRVQMIFQDPYASLNPRWRVGDIVAEPIRTLKLRPDEAATRRRVDELLSLVGLSPADGRKYPHEFSGGQRQRISIARALATEAEFLVCDEPTSALDVSVQAQILNLMRDLQRKFGLTYVFISHNLSVVRHMSERVAVMYLGRLVEEAAAETLFADPRHPYTRLLLDTIPDLEAPNRHRQPMGGEVPSPIAPPPGCTFHPRCPLVREACRKGRPDLRLMPDGARLACIATQEAEARLAVPA